MIAERTRAALGVLGIRVVVEAQAAVQKQVVATAARQVLLWGWMWGDIQKRCATY
jgi:hypothetical protein